MDWNQKRVLVTGAGGFLGSHLCERLVADGARVTALVRYNSRGSHGFLEESAPDVKRAVTVVLGDIKDESTFRAHLGGVDIVFHLAAVPGIPYSFVHPHDIFDTNIGGSLNLLNASRDFDLQKIILLSSGETYGDAQYTPIDEKHPQVPKSPYAASKAAMENIAWSYLHCYGLPVTVVRLFNNYGPRQSARAITPTIIAQMLQGEELRIGAIEPKRDFTYVLDTVDALLRVAGLTEAGEVYNIGSSVTLSVGDIIGKVKHLTGRRNIRIITDESRIRPKHSEVALLRSDCTHLRERTGWKPCIGYEQGLEMTIAWMRDHLELYKPGRYAI